MSESYYVHSRNESSHVTSVLEITLHRMRLTRSRLTVRKDHTRKSSHHILLNGFSHTFVHVLLRRGLVKHLVRLKHRGRCLCRSGLAHDSDLRFRRIALDVPVLVLVCVFSLLREREREMRDFQRERERERFSKRDERFSE